MLGWHVRSIHRRPSAGYPEALPLCSVGDADGSWIGGTDHRAPV